MPDLENNNNPENPETPPDVNNNRRSVHDTFPLISPIAAAFLGLIGGVLPLPVCWRNFNFANIWF